MSIELLEGGRRIFNDPRLDKQRVALLMHLALNEAGAPPLPKIVRDYIKALEAEIINTESREWMQFSQTTWDQWDTR